MASSAAIAAMKVTHTAGIYADMTVDGPEIGTLVLIVDRAKNLPNRKSMGKQDPYCAARLGKDAKKTETDKRGGQTPKWDQELRFTVHDSPDYYNLKVSVFNDDKKTELIGETWVGLENIIIPGGGQNDRWHSLNCKGRFAGEIRIELTYYDTRPRENKPEERRQAAQVDALPVSAREGLSGPRQPKPVKRRPLPADPTNPTHSSPVPYTPPADSQRPHEPHTRYGELPEDFAFSTAASYDNRHQRALNGQSRESPLDLKQRSQESYGGIMAPSPIRSNTDSSALYSAAPQDGFRQNAAMPPTHSQPDVPFYDQTSDYDVDSDDPSYGPALNPPYQNSSNGMNNHQQQQPSHDVPGPVYPATSLPYSTQPQRSSLPQNNNYSEGRGGSDPRRKSNNAWIGEDSSAPGARSPESAPPPPVHKSSPRVNGHAEPMGNTPIPVTAPLNIRHGRGSVGGSPLTQVQSNDSALGYPLSVSPQSSQLFTNTSSVSPLTSRDNSLNHQADTLPQSPERDYGNEMPPSLVPGYEPSIAAEESERMLREQRMSARQTYVDPMLPQYQPAAQAVPQGRAQPVAEEPQRHLREQRMGDRQYYVDAPTPLPEQVTQSVSQSRSQPVADEPERFLREQRMSGRHRYTDPGMPRYQQAFQATHSRTQPAVDEPERPHEQRMSARQIYPDQALPRYQQQTQSSSQGRHQPTADDPERVREHRMNGRQIHPDPAVHQYQHAAHPAPQSRPHPIPRAVVNVQDRRAHRVSAPVIKPRAVSPDVRTPARKSLSPQPGSAPSERPRSELPFSPDSYNAFNPSLDAAISVNEAGARYNTPEQAREAFEQHEREAKLGDGPIIGNDGRIIDPSDHLPTDTWAPEPEQKKPRKGPEVTIRFKNSPQGAQPMPNPRRPLSEARANVISSPPLYSRSADNTPAVIAEHPVARLQKNNPRAAIHQPASSSPIVPTMMNNSPVPNPMARAPASDYPLREHINYGYNNNINNAGPSYMKRVQGGGVAPPPPIPAKIPISSGQEDWGASALSEEMSRIDIGVGSRQRLRRSRYGA